VTSLTNSAGLIVESYDYKVYGERTISGSGLTDIGYTGQRHDSETGLMYFKNRYYSTSMGSFVIGDPLGYVDGASMYLGYFGGNGVDPLGLDMYGYDFIGPIQEDDYRSITYSQKEVEKYSNLKFKGWDDKRLENLDKLIKELVDEFNNNKTKFCGRSLDQLFKIPDLNYRLVKSWALRESGGGTKRDIAAWAKDPFQVNVAGDWIDEKTALGLVKPKVRNEGNLKNNMVAAVKFLCWKGFSRSGKKPENSRKFKTWEEATKAYKGDK